MANKWEELLTRRVVLPPSSLHPTTHPTLTSTCSLHSLRQLVCKAQLLLSVTSTFLSSLLGGCTPRGVVGTAPESVQVSPLHFTTSLARLLHHHLFALLGLTGPTGERPLEVAIGSQYPTQRAKREDMYRYTVHGACWITATPTHLIIILFLFVSLQKLNAK